MASEFELRAFAELAEGVASAAEDQLKFMRGRPARSVEACDAELDRLLDDVSLLARVVTALAKHSAEQAVTPNT